MQQIISKRHIRSLSAGIVTISFSALLYNKTKKLRNKNSNNNFDKFIDEEEDEAEVKNHHSDYMYIDPYKIYNEFHNYAINTEEFRNLKLHYNSSSKRSIKTYNSINNAYYNDLKKPQRYIISCSESKQSTKFLKFIKPEIKESKNITISNEDLANSNLFYKKYNFSTETFFLGDKKPPKNICFEGGGIKGISYAGSLKALTDYNLISNIDSVLGSSAGSGFALMLCLGFSYEAIYKIMLHTDITTFKDGSCGLFRDFYRLCKTNGWNKGDYLKFFYESILMSKHFPKDITFEELYSKTNKELIITGTSLTKNKTHYFSHKNKEFPNMKVADAVRISMSIPFYFSAVKLNNEIMVDGGVIEHHPVKYWDDKNDKSDNFNTETIGFLLNSPEEFQECYENKIDNLIDFSKQVFNSMTKKVENKDFNSKARKTRVIEINTGDISAIEYELSKEQKNFLVFSGYVSTIDFLIENKYIKEILNKDDVDEMRQYIKWYLERSHCGNK